MDSNEPCQGLPRKIIIWNTLVGEGGLKWIYFTI